MASRVSIGMELINGEELVRVLEKLAWDVRYEVTDKAVRAGSKPVLARMRALAPDSRKTGTLKKQSRSTRSKWKNAARLKNVLRAVHRKGSKGMFAYVGPSYTDGGGHGNFFSKNHDRKVLWGKQASGVRIMNRFVKDAADQTRSEVKSTMLAVIKREIDHAARLAARK